MKHTPNWGKLTLATALFLAPLGVAAAPFGPEIQITSDSSEHLYDPYTPEPLPAGAPAWLREIARDPSGVNFARMDSLFRQWMAEDVDARVKTIERKPAVNFYRRWEKAYRPYVREHGRIVLPTFSEHLAMIDARNAAPFRNTRGQNETLPRWRNIGPNATFENKGSGLREKDSQVCVFRISVAPTDHNVVYCGTETGVVFKTTDKGLTWRACRGEHDFGGSIYAIHVSPHDANTVYVGGGQNLWKTTDGGETWTREPDIRSRVNSIRIHPENPDHITLCAGLRDDEHSGFFVSTDGGKSYRQTINGIAHDHELQPGRPLRQYALVRPKGSDGFRFFITEDGGENFSEVQLPVTPIAAGRLSVSAAPNGENYVYALVNRSRNTAWDSGPLGGEGEPYVLKSTDGGLTWEDQTTRSSATPSRNTFSGFADETTGGQGYFDMTIGASNKNPEHLIFGLCNAYRSTQGGKGGWYTTGIGGYVATDKMHPDIQDIAVAGEDTWIVTDGGVKYSTDFFATPGENRHKGIYAADYHGFGQGWNEDFMAGGRWHNGDVVHSAGYGEGTTLHVGGVEQSTGHVFLSRPRTAYFSDAATVEAPATLQEAPRLNYGQMTKKPYETLRTAGEIAFDPRFARRFIMTSAEDPYQLFLTEDEGQSFRRIFDAEGELICSYAFARSNPDYIYVAGVYDIYRSSDGGDSWEMFPQRAFNVESSFSVNSTIAIDPKDETKLWHVSSNKPGEVAYTTDGGQTWTNPLSDHLKQRIFQWIVLAGDEHNGVYLATMDGASIYYKDDTMTDWSDYSAGLNPGARITRLVPFFKEGKLRAATNQGIWEIPLVRPNFVPVAQPMALNLGHGDLTSSPSMEVQLDSYSIVNQSSATWQWTFSPQPEWVSDAAVRNPRVRFTYPGVYDVTLTVTTPEGTHSRTMQKMIRTGEVPTAINAAPAAAPKVEATYRDGIVRLSAEGLATEKVLTLHNAKGALLHKVVLSPTQTTAEIALSAPQGILLYELRTVDYKFFGKLLGE